MSVPSSFPGTAKTTTSHEPTAKKMVTSHGSVQCITDESSRSITVQKVVRGGVPGKNNFPGTHALKHDASDGTACRRADT